MAQKEIYEPISVVCKDCRKSFVITPEEQKHFKSMGFELPKRCQDCRRIRKEAKKVAEAKEKDRREALDKEERQKKWEADEKELEQIIKTLPFQHVSVNEMILENPSCTLVIIGNDFQKVAALTFFHTILN